MLCPLRKMTRTTEQPGEVVTTESFMSCNPECALFVWENKYPDQEDWGYCAHSIGMRPIPGLHRNHTIAPTGSGNL